MERIFNIAALYEVQANPLPHAAAGDTKFGAILAVAFTIFGAISLLIITVACPDGSIVYRHDSLWFGREDKGSYVTSWAAGSDDVKSYRYSQKDGYSDEEHLDKAAMARIEASLNRSFPEKPEQEPTPEETPKVTLAQRLLGKSARRNT